MHAVHFVFCFCFFLNGLLVCFQLITPFVKLDIKYYDLGLPHRHATDDKVTVESAEATKKYAFELGIKKDYSNHFFSLICFSESDLF